jgi:hypothetical protein
MTVFVFPRLGARSRRILALIGAISLIVLPDLNKNMMQVISVELYGYVF